MDDQSYKSFKEDFVDTIWKELDPFEREIEDTENIPNDRIFPILDGMGAFALMVPEQFGGKGLTVSQYLPILSELSKIQGGIRVLVHVHNTNAHAFSEIANDDWRDALLPGVAHGTKSVAFGLTEPDHGTGADLGTRIDRDGDEFVITGRKWLITNSDFASHFVIYGKTTSDDGVKVSAVLVERDNPGLRIEALPETMGCKGGEHGLLTLKEVRVPVTNLFGAEGRGLEQMAQTLEPSRLYISASSLGTAQRALELAIEHSKSRYTFGKPLAQRQMIQRYIAEMGTDVYALRSMITDAAEKWDRGLRIPAEASMCKLFGLEAVGRVTDRALLVFGGIGYTRAHPIERLYRDARLNWLEEGPPTVQYLVAARALIEGHEWDR